MVNLLGKHFYVLPLLLDYIVRTCCSIGDMSCLHTVSVSVIAPPPFPPSSFSFFFFWYMTMQAIQWLPPAWQLRALTHSFTTTFHSACCSVLGFEPCQHVLTKGQNVFAVLARKILVKSCQQLTSFKSMQVNFRGKAKIVFLLVISFSLVFFFFFFFDLHVLVLCFAMRFCSPIITHFAF